MKAVRIRRFGPPSVITTDDLPRPEARAGQVLVRVKAAEVGNWDALIRAGNYLAGKNSTWGGDR
jgi:NADPH:quinone reductase-like Zn-dependent oxidoreductase